MVLLSAVLWAAWQGLQSTRMVCGNLVDAKTAPIRSAAGFAVALMAHSEDDHGKNTHLCQVVYKVAVVAGERAPIFTNLDNASDGAWGRSIVFGLNGFSKDGAQVFGFTSEYGRYPFFEVLSYSLLSGTSETQSVRRSLFRGLSSACVDTLGVLGTASEGTAVIGTVAKGKCTRAAMWKVLPGVGPDGDHKIRRLPRAFASLPLDLGVTESSDTK